MQYWNTFFFSNYVVEFIDFCNERTIGMILKIWPCPYIENKSSIIFEMYEVKNNMWQGEMDKKYSTLDKNETWNNFDDK